MGFLVKILHKTEIWSVKCKPLNIIGKIQKKKKKKKNRHAVSPVDNNAYLFKVSSARPVNIGQKSRFVYCSVINPTYIGFEETSCHWSDQFYLFLNGHTYQNGPKRA